MVEGAEPDQAQDQAEGAVQAGPHHEGHQSRHHGQQEPHKPGQPPGEPVQGVALGHRVGVELRGVRISRPEQGQIADLAHVSPAQLRILAGLDRDGVAALFRGLRVPADPGRLAGTELGKKDPEFLEMEPLGRHVLQPQLQAVQVEIVHRDQPAHDIPLFHGRSSSLSASATQARSRATSS